MGGGGGAALRAPRLDMGTCFTGLPSFFGMWSVGGILHCHFLSTRLERGQKLEGLGATFLDSAIT